MLCFMIAGNEERGEKQICIKKIGLSAVDDKIFLESRDSSIPGTYLG